MHYMIMKLNATGHVSSLLDHVKDTVISPGQIPGYCGSDITGLPSQERMDMDLLVEFFAGWGLMNCHRFRHFVAVTYSKPLPRWSAWSHLEVKHGRRQLFSRFHADEDALRKTLEGDNTSP